MTDTLVLGARDVHKSYREGPLAVDVLRGATLEVAAAEIVAIVGASGSGKSILLHVLGGLDALDSGTVRIDGSDLAKLSDAQRGRVRNERLGFVYQFHHLLPEFNAVDNVGMPLAIRRMPLAAARQRAQQALSAVGLAERLQHHPGELSGGERQRTAIARGIVTQPARVLADDPTGNLDTHTSDSIFELLRQFNREQRTAFLVVTHDSRLPARCDRIVELVDGRIAGDRPNAAMTPG